MSKPAATGQVLQLMCVTSARDPHFRDHYYYHKYNTVSLNTTQHYTHSYTRALYMVYLESYFLLIAVSSTFLHVIIQHKPTKCTIF